MTGCRATKLSHLMQPEISDTVVTTVLQVRLGKSSQDHPEVIYIKKCLLFFLLDHGN